MRSLGNIPRFFIDPGLFSGDPDKSMYRPLLLVSYALNYAVGGYDPFGFLLVNWGLHLACSLLVWRIGRRLLGEREALVAGFFFTVHPLATEPVNYISSRSESLAAFFFLGTFLLHLRGENRPKFRYSGLGCYALGLLGKSVVITAPAVLLACDLLVRGKRKIERIYALYAIVGGGYLLLIRQNGFLTRSLATPVRDWGTQWWTQLKAPAYYLKLILLPHGLNVEHQFWEAAGPESLPSLLGLLLVVSLLALVSLGRGSRVPVFSLIWGMIVLLPTMAMPLNMLVNERRLYLVLAGCAWFLGYFSRQIDKRALLPGMLLLGILTFQRNFVWESELTLWQDASRKAPGMERAQTNLGKALQLSGDVGGALAAYRRSIEIDPAQGEPYNNIATIYHEEARRQEDAGRRRALLGQAIDWYRMAVERYPEYGTIYQNMGDAYTQMGELQKGRKMYEQALEIQPESGAIWTNYGQTLYLLGEFELAEQAFLRGMELLPEQAEAYNNLGNVYSRQKRWRQAVEAYEQALERSPAQANEVRVNLADTYREIGDFSKARKVILKTVEDEPDLVMAWYQLGRIERETGDAQAAIDAFVRTVELDPGHARARAELGELYSQGGDLDRAVTSFRTAVEIDSTYSRAWYGLGIALERRGDREEALRAYRHFVDLWSGRDDRFDEVTERMSRLREQQKVRR